MKPINYSCLAFLLAIILLVGCAQVHPGKIRGPDLAKLRLGMSKQEVIGVLGEPQSVGANERYETYRYFEDHGRFVFIYHELIFIDGKLKLFGLADNPDFKAKVEVIIKKP